MKFKIVIVAVAAFSCLVPQALGSIILAKKAVAAVKGAGILAAKGAAIGATALAAKGAAVAVAKGVTAALASKGVVAIAAKGAAIKGAALLAAKGAVAKGAALFAAKGAVVKKVATLAVKGAALAGAVALGAKAVKSAKLPLFKPWFHHPAYYPSPALSYVPVYEVRPTAQAIPPVPPQFPAVLSERLNWLYDTAKTAATQQANAVTDLVNAVHQSKFRSAPVVLGVENQNPGVYSVPIVEKVE